MAMQLRHRLDGSWDLQDGTKAPKDWNVSPRFINKGIQAGFLAWSDDGQVLIMTLESGIYRYKVTAEPGRYDDENEPAGYRVDNFYALKKEGR